MVDLSLFYKHCHFTVYVNSKIFWRLFFQDWVLGDSTIFSGLETIFLGLIGDYSDFYLHGVGVNGYTHTLNVSFAALEKLKNRLMKFFHFLCFLIIFYGGEETCNLLSPKLGQIMITIGSN